MKARFLLLIFTAILLSACAATTPTPSARPKAMDTVSPEARTTPTVAVTATDTLTPQATNTIPAASIQASYNLPDWMAKPNTNIVATITDWQNRAYQLTLFGEATNEKYEMTLPENLKGYFWKDAVHFGFLNQDNTVSILDLQTGKTSNQNISPQSLRFLKSSDNSTPKALIVSKPIGHNQDFFFVFASEKNTFSNDWKYRAHQEDYLSSEGNITVENTNTGETFPVTNPKDHLWDVNFKWSNNTPAQLSILQSKTFPEGRVHGDQIMVVNPATKETFGPYVDNYSYDFEWSPDDKKFLFDDYDRNIACIFDREENKHNCIHGMQPKSNGLFKWSQDQKNILFEYYVFTSTNDGDNFSGNFCQFNLINGTTTCLTEEIDELKHNSITDYQISPDGRYVILQLECRALGMDFACNTTHALMSLDGEIFQILDSKYYENIGSIGAEELLWRPLP